MQEPTDLEQYVAGSHELDTSDMANHVVRTAVLEQVALLDYALNDVLAMRIARVQQTHMLAERVFSHLPMNDRISMFAHDHGGRGTGGSLAVPTGRASAH